MRKTTKDQVKGGKIVKWKKLFSVLEFFDVQKEPIYFALGVLVVRV